MRIKEFLKKHLLLLSAMVISALVLLVCSKSSPLYPMNDWVDVHCFLTLGKGLLNGLIPYVDLYEQKGPVLYFIYAIVALFCNGNMFGQYLLEVVTFGLFLYFSAKLAGLYLGETSKYRYPIMGVLAVVVATTASFCHGGSVEQMCLFLFVYGLYSVLRASHEKRCLSFREALTNGVLAGVAFWIKYTMVGFYLGLALAVIILYLARLKDWKKLLSTIGQFLLGFGIVSTIVLIFFLCVGGLKELFTCYFYNNIFLYSEGTGGFNLTSIFLKLRASLNFNKIFPVYLFLGLGFLLFRSGKHRMDCLTAVLSFMTLSIFTFISHNYPYYSLVLSAYTVFGLTGVAWVLREMQVSKLIHKLTGGKALISAGMICVFLALCIFPACRHSSNTYLMKYNQEDMPQYKFAKIINETENPTLLNFGFLDGGFYYAADVLPNCPFFCTFNVEAPDMYKTQYEYVLKEKVDYVITRNYTLDRYGIDTSAYELVDTAEMYFENVDFVYYLYRLKGDTQ